jgi:hypothetical protein
MKKLLIGTALLFAALPLKRGINAAISTPRLLLRRCLILSWKPGHYRLD